MTNGTRLYKIAHPTYRKYDIVKLINNELEGFD